MDIKKRTNFIERTDAMKSYLKDLNKLKVMTPEREKALFDEYKNTDDEYRKLQIRNEIIEGNQRFIFAITKRYATDELLNDLISVANIGAMEAFEDYDPSTGNRFNTLADYYIRRAINAYLNKDNMMVRPTNNARIAPKIKKIENNFYIENGRAPLASELADILFDEYGIDVKNINDICGANIDYIDDNCSQDDDEYTKEDNSDFAVQSASRNAFMDEVDSEDLASTINNALNSLSQREATIVKMATGTGGYYKEYKDKEIATELGISSERVRQLRNQAMDKLKTILAPSLR